MTAKPKSTKGKRPMPVQLRWGLSHLVELLEKKVASPSPEGALTTPVGMTSYEAHLTLNWLRQQLMDS